MSSNRYDTSDPSTKAYKHKYLKYKTKYLQLSRSMNGGDWASMKAKMSKTLSSVTAAILPNAVILSKLDVISPLLSNVPESDKFGRPILIDCTSFEKLINGKSHVLLKNSAGFRQFIIPTTDAEKIQYKDTNMYMTVPLCAKTQISETTKDVGKQVNVVTKDLRQQINTASKDIGQQVNRAAQDMSKHIGKELSAAVQNVSTQIGKEITSATKNISRGVGAKITKATTQLTTAPHSGGMKGGDAESSIKDVIKELWGVKEIADFKETIKEYDVVIKYIPGTPKSSITITKLV